MGEIVRYDRGGAPAVRSGARTTFVRCVRSWCVAVLGAAGLWGSAGAAEPAGPGFERGRLSELASDVNKVLQLTLDGDRLRLDRDRRQAEFAKMKPDEILAALTERLVKRGFPKQFAQDQARQMMGQPALEFGWQELQQAAGANHTGTSGGQGSRELRFGGRGLTGILSVRDKLLRVSLTEEASPDRAIEITDDGQGMLRLNLSKGDGTQLLVLLQSPKSKLHVVDIRGERARNFTAASFLELYRGQREYVDGELFPLLRHVGIGTPLSAYAGVVQDRVVARLEPMSKDEEARATAALDALEADDFQEREQAAAVLSSHFDRWRDVILRRLRDESLTAETQARLKRLLAERPDNESVDELISRLGLPTDIPYLIHLLGAVPAERRPVVADALKRLTGQDFGTDPVRWKSWHAEQPAKS